MLEINDAGFVCKYTRPVHCTHKSVLYIKNVTQNICVCIKCDHVKSIWIFNKDIILAIFIELHLPTSH